MTNREKRKRRASGYAADPRTIPNRAKSVGMAARGLYGEIAKNRGPAVTYLSERRRIIEDGPWAEWLKARRENPPPEVTGYLPPNRRPDYKPADKGAVPGARPALATVE